MNQTSNLIEPKAYAVKFCPDEKRRQSQSGGAFSALAEHILSIGGVVYGVGQNEDLKVLYKRTDKLQDLCAIKGSKYVQAYNEGVFLKVEEDLRGGKTVLFSGTPCMVDSLNKYLDKKHCNIVNLFTCDIVCHGAPSQVIFEQYLALLKKQRGEKIKQFVFRDKSFGWRRNISSYYYKGKRMITSNYIKIFESQLCLKSICYECSYASIHRCSDITVGDYWGIEKVHPEFEDTLGVSLLLCNSEKGAKLFEKVKDKLHVIETKIEDALQPNLQRPTPKPKEYDDFWECCKGKGYEEAFRRYCGYNPDEDWEKLEKNQYIKRLISKIERTVKRKK